MSSIRLQDRIRAVRVLADLQSLAAVYALSSSLEAAEGAATDDLLDWLELVYTPMDALFDRLSGEGNFLLHLAKSIEDRTLEDAFADIGADLQGPWASVSMISQGGRAARELIESRLQLFDDAMASARKVLRADRKALKSTGSVITMDWPYLVESAVGSGLVVACSVASALATELELPSALVLGRAGSALGARMAVSGNPPLVPS